jgi:hypothetical protein
MALLMACAVVQLLPELSSAETILSMRYDVRQWQLQSPEFPSGLTIGQTALPLAITGDMASGVDYFVTGTFLRSSMNTNVMDESLSGATALSGELRWRSGTGQDLVLLGLTVPSGRRELSTLDLAMLRVLAIPTLGFGVTQYGKGAEVALAFNKAVPVGGSTLVSGGAGGIWRGSYEFAQGAEALTPASELRATTGLAYRSSDLMDSRSADLDLTLRFFGPDKLGGDVVYRQATQVEAGVRGKAQFETFAVTCTARLVENGPSSSTDPLGSALASQRQFLGNVLDLRVGLMPVTSKENTVRAEAQYIHAAGSTLVGRNGDSEGVVVTIPLHSVATHRLRAHVGVHRCTATILDPSWGASGVVELDWVMQSRAPK